MEYLSNCKGCASEMSEEKKTGTSILNLSKKLDVETPPDPAKILSVLSSIQEASQNPSNFKPILFKSIKYIFTFATNSIEEELQLNGLRLLRLLFSHYGPLLVGPSESSPGIQPIETCLEQIMLCNTCCSQKLWNELDHCVIALSSHYPAIITLLFKISERTPSMALSQVYRVCVLLMQNINSIQDLFSLLKFHSLQDINNPDPWVRKGVVSLLVEFSILLGEQFESAFSELSPSQKKIVSIYKQKRVESNY